VHSLYKLFIGFHRHLLHMLPLDQTLQCHLVLPP
jgi:hypothetical protein